MARVTLKERRDQLKSELQQLNSERLEAFLKENGSPTKIYKCGLFGEIEEYAIEKIYPYYPTTPNVSFNREPTRRLISELESYLENVKDASPHYMILYKTKYGIPHTSWNDVLSHKGGLAFDEEGLSEQSAHNKEKYAPREGYTACEYCRTQVKNEELVARPIWGKGRNNSGSTYTTKGNYGFCSADCAMHAQMSREG